MKRTAINIHYIILCHCQRSLFHQFLRYISSRHFISSHPTSAPPNMLRQWPKIVRLPKQQSRSLRSATQALQPIFRIETNDLGHVGKSEFTPKDTLPDKDDFSRPLLVSKFHFYLPPPHPVLVGMRNLPPSHSDSSCDFRSWPQFPV